MFFEAAHEALIHLYYIRMGPLSFYEKNSSLSVAKTLDVIRRKGKQGKSASGEAACKEGREDSHEISSFKVNGETFFLRK